MDPTGSAADGRTMLCWLLMIATVAPFRPFTSANANLRTLRTFQMHACEGEELRIECWPNTVISINVARYGSSISQDVICPMDTASHLANASTNPCRAQHALQVSYNNVEALCKEQRVCSFVINPKTFGGDPCPGFMKYAEVAYKCRPNTFFNKAVCEGEKLRLRCHKSLRIVIYSAEFGSIAAGVPECPQVGHHKPEDCQANYATETVMNSCHGKRKCLLITDKETFGNPGCSKKTRLFLKVVYTCVPKDTLQDLEVTEETEEHDYTSIFDESQQVRSSDEYTDHVGIDIKLTTPVNHHYPDDLLNTGMSTTKKTDVQSDENTNEGAADVNCTVLSNEQKVIGFITEWIAAYKFISENKEKFILYMTVSLGAGLLAFLVVLAARLYIQQQRDLKRAKLNISEPLPVALDDDYSDTDQYDPRLDHSVEVVRYTDMSTIRRQDSDSHPRAPLSHSMNNYYYS